MSQTLTSPLVHLIFSTKNRVSIITHGSRLREEDFEISIGRMVTELLQLPTRHARIEVLHREPERRPSEADIQEGAD